MQYAVDLQVGSPRNTMSNMRTTLYDSAGRFVAQLGELTGDATAIVWDQRSFLRQDVGDYIEVAELPPGIVPHRPAPGSEGPRNAETKEFGEPTIGNESRPW
jgi:hypothetical protein